MALKPFHEVLINEGILDPDEYKKVTEATRTSPYKLVQFLIKKGLVPEEEGIRLLADHLGLSYVDRLEPKNIDEIIPQVPVRFVQKYRIAPFFKEKNTIKVAMNDPTMLHPLDEFRQLFMGVNVQLVLSRESEILKIIHNHFEKEERDAVANELSNEGLEFLDDIQDLHDSMDLANQAPIIRMVNMILSNGVNERASDIHIEPQEKEITVRYRIDGVLHKVLSPPRSIQSGIISRIKIMANMNIAENRLPQDGRIKIRFSGKEIDVRVSSLPAQFGERIVMRLLNKTDTKFELDGIGFDQEMITTYRNMIQQTNGIVLITGPTGSGKTTTLYASLTELNDEARNIITVEDPVEYQMNGISQVQARHKIGFSFAEGLRSILRQDPDIIMVGEIRDEETARVAIQSSLTGHLVFSTLHTNDAPSAVTRLLDMGIEPYLIASTCRGFMAQRLLRRLCPNCKKPATITGKELLSLGIIPRAQADAGVSKKTKAKSRAKTKSGQSLAKGASAKSKSTLDFSSIKPTTKYKIFEPVGCKECMHSGYKGRSGIYELLAVDNDVRKVIIENPSLDKLREAALKTGMQTLRSSALHKVLESETSMEEALRVT